MVTSLAFSTVYIALLFYQHMFKASTLVKRNWICLPYLHLAILFSSNIILHRLCGETPNFGTFQTTNNEALVIFESYLDVNDKPGFNLDYSLGEYYFGYTALVRVPGVTTYTHVQQKPALLS